MSQVLKIVKNYNGVQNHTEHKRTLEIKLIKISRIWTSDVCSNPWYWKYIFTPEMISTSTCAHALTTSGVKKRASFEGCVSCVTTAYGLWCNQKQLLLCLCTCQNMQLGWGGHFISELRRRKTWGLMYKRCVRTKTWRTLFFTATFRCIKSEMTVEMCGASRQLHGWRTHISTAVDPLATLRGDAGKLNKCENN